MTSRSETTRPQEQTPVRMIMKLWPKTIRLFLARGMACVGCPVGGLHTLEEACTAHHIALDPLIAEITEVARTTRGRFPRQRFPLPAGTADVDR
jgi:hybrid cluster-associated redox disulfide protein